MNRTTAEFEKLKPYIKRKFVSPDASLTDAATIKQFYQLLLDRKIHSKKELEEWLLDRSELEAAIAQSGDILYIRMTCQTDDPQRAQAHQAFLENIEPIVKEHKDQLNKKFLYLLKSYPLHKDRYGVYIREVRTDVGLFVQENIPLQTKLGLLSQEYQTICGAMTVDFEGKERTMPEMAKYLLEPDRHLRESAWRAMTKRRLQDKDKLDELFDKMLMIRCQIAQNAKCKNYTEYVFRLLHRFDYTLADCKKYHQTVEKVVVPLWRKILEDRRQRMGLKTLKPWDTACDPLGKPPLKPFQDIQDLVNGCQRIFRSLDKKLGEYFGILKEEGLLDLVNRKGKAPGGYQSTLDEARKPFIFMNAVGVNEDVRTLLHEAGHAFHALSCAPDPLLAYRHGPMEFNEVASMAMELLADDYLTEFYSSEDHQRSKKDQLEDAVYILVWVATIDAFQHWIYENPRHQSHQRKEAWIKIYNRFSGMVVDWNGLEEEQAYLWHRQLHIFEYPFYYIEYGIAQLGALQLWLQAKKTQAKAVRNYRKALSLGGSKPLPELYAAAGIRFNFSSATITPLIKAVQEEWCLL